MNKDENDGQENIEKEKKFFFLGCVLRCIKERKYHSPHPPIPSPASNLPLPNPTMHRLLFPIVIPLIVFFILVYRVVLLHALRIKSIGSRILHGHSRCYGPGQSQMPAAGGTAAMPAAKKSMFESSSVQASPSSRRLFAPSPWPPSTLEAIATMVVVLMSRVTCPPTTSMSPLLLPH